MAIPSELFAFLRDLQQNNNREWFQSNKSRYEQSVKGPLLAFVGEFAEPLAQLSTHFVADPRPSGGSMFRIFRDVRFSKDKSPYKTNAGVHFRHEHAKDVHAPGYYLHLALEGCYVAAGLWQPESAQQKQIRAAIDHKRTEWRRACGSAQAAGFALGGEELKRPPQGYSADHPLIEDLKRKDFVLSREVSGVCQDSCRVFCDDIVSSSTFS